MIYVMAGKREIYDEFEKQERARSRNDSGEIVVTKYVYQSHGLNTFNHEDTLVLLPGWWGRSWAKKQVKGIIDLYPNRVLCNDGMWGAEVRKELFAEPKTGDFSRFDIMDLGD